MIKERHTRRTASRTDQVVGFVLVFAERGVFCLTAESGGPSGSRIRGTDRRRGGSDTICVTVIVRLNVCFDYGKPPIRREPSADAIDPQVPRQFDGRPL